MNASEPLRQEEALILVGDTEGLIEHTDKLDSLAERVLAIEKIETETQAKEITEMLVVAKQANKALEEARKEAKEPHLSRGRAVDELFKPAGSRFKQLEGHMRALLAKYIDEKRREDERRRREAEEKRRAAERERAAALQAAAEAKSAKTKAEAEAKADDAELEASILAEKRDEVVVKRGVESANAKASSNYRDVPYITDIKKVPREFLEQACELDGFKQLLRVLKMRKITEAPGVNVKQELVIRTMGL